MNKKNIGRTLGPLGMLLVVFGGIFVFFMGLTEKTALPIKSDYAWVPWAEVLVGLAFIGIYAATAFDDVRNIATGRGTAFVLSSSVSIIALVVVLAGVNYWATSKTLEWDFTKAGIHTLSDQTTGLLGALDDSSKVKATIFYRAADPQYAEVDALLEKYKKVAGDRFTYEFVDYQKNPKLVKDFGITPDGPRIILKSANGKEARAKENTEESVTNAFAELGRGLEKKVYFTTGHGEKPASGEGHEGQQGLKLWTAGMVNEGYKVESLNTLAKKDIPDDAQALIVAGPVSPFTEGEVAAIEAYADKGGRVVLMLEPGVESGLEQLARKWGVELLPGIVVDPASQEPLWAFTQDFSKHPIATPTRSIFGALAFVFPEARGLRKAGGEGFEVTELFKTGPEAWGENDPLPQGTAEEVKVEKGSKDDSGPIALGAAVSKKLEGDKEFRGVVFGDSDFVINGFIRQGGNRDLALNTLQWLGGQEQKITIRPKLREKSNLVFLSGNKKMFLAFGALNLLPLALIGVGLSVWMRRRSR